MQDFFTLVPDCMIQVGTNDFKCSKYGFVLKNAKLPIRCSKCRTDKPATTDGIQIIMMSGDLQQLREQERLLSNNMAPSGWDPTQDSRGFGDTVAKVTSFFGIKPCGGCKERQEKLNKIFPYSPNKDNPEMKSPQNQWCIQLEVTNFCPKSCSNCTRHCPHIKDPYFMDMDTFTRAVKSMDGYCGMLGIQGGEPTLHPKFEEMIGVYTELWTPDKQIFMGGRKPIIDFGGYLADNLSDGSHKRGLWSALGPGYYKHFELIQETFGYQCLNDHKNPARHTPFLVTRKELGIKDRDWIRYRNNCWVQQLWSSSITPKGAFPCEIMASLDTLYNGPGGWDIEPGWWKREYKDFGKMVDICELCCGCIPLEEREAREQIQDISKKHLQMLKDVQSPAVEKGQYNIFDGTIKHDAHRDSGWYMPDDWQRQRVSKDNKSIKPKFLEGLTVCVGLAQDLAITLPRNIKNFDRFIVVTTSDDLETQEVVKSTSAELLISDSCYDNGDAFNKAKMANKALEQLEFKDWMLFIDADVLLPENFRENLFNLVLNPGCMYFTKRLDVDNLEEVKAGQPVKLKELYEPNTNFRPYGYFQLINKNARAIKKYTSFKYPECFCSAGNMDSWLFHVYPHDKKIPLDSDSSTFDLGHINHGNGLGNRWNGYKNNNGWKYCGQSNFFYENKHILSKRHNIDLQHGFIRLIDVINGKIIGIIDAHDLPYNTFVKIPCLIEYQYKQQLNKDEECLVTKWDDIINIYSIGIPKKYKYLEGIIVCVGLSNDLQYTLPHNSQFFDKLVVVTTSDDIETQNLVKSTSATLVISDSCYENDEAFNKGKMVNVGLKELQLKDWVLFLDADIILPDNFRTNLENKKLDKNILYYTKRLAIENVNDLKHGGKPRLASIFHIHHDFNPWGFFQLWNGKSETIQKIQPLKYPECFCSAASMDNWFENLFPQNKKLPLNKDSDEFHVGHIAHGELGTRWNGNDRKITGWRFVGQSNGPEKLQLDLNSKGFLRIGNVSTGTASILEVSPKLKYTYHIPPHILDYQYKEELSQEEQKQLMSWDDFLKNMNIEQKPCIGFLTPNLYLGGAQLWLTSLVEGLSDDFRIGFVGNFTPWTSIPIVWNKLTSKTYVCEFPIEFDSWSRKCDIMIAWGLNDLKVLQNYTGKVVLVAHNNHEYTRKMNDQCKEQTTHRVVVSNSIKEVFDSKYKVSTIYNGIDEERCKITINKDKVRKEWGIKDGEIVIGYVGRFWEEHIKNVTAIVNGVKELGDGYRLVLVGSTVGDLGDKTYLINEWKQILPDLVYLSPETQVGNLYNAFDCLAITSKTEGFGLVLAEAWYCKCPTISTNVGVIECSTDEQPLSIILPDNPSPCDVADGIKKAISKDNINTVQRAFDFVNKEFLTQHFHDRWKDYLNKILKESLYDD